MAKAIRITVTAKFRPRALSGDSDMLAHVVLTVAFNAAGSEAGLP